MSTGRKKSIKISTKTLAFIERVQYTKNIANVRTKEKTL
nr:MAG TPA: hypothetical protein [Caudoviricetes sp.]